MTSGTKVIDERYYVTGNYTTCYGPAVIETQNRVGFYSRKEWQGSNTPPASKAVDTQQRVSYRISAPDGTFSLRKRTLRLPKPKRSSHPLQENGYRMSLVVTQDFMYDFKKSCSVRPDIPFRSTSESTEGFNNCVFPGAFWTPDDEYAVIQRLSDQIQGQGFNAAVFLGEGREAMQTIADSARRITKAYKRIRKGDVVGAGKALVGARARKGGRNIPSSEVNADWLTKNWLSLQYGWLPLISDAFNAAKHFAWLMERDQPMVYRAHRRKAGVGVSVSPGAYRQDGEVEIIHSIKAIVTRINQVALLGLLDPASLLWEKLPWSFVADWFIPIGNYLEAVNLDRSLSAKYVISHKESRVCNNAYSPIDSFDGYFYATLLRKNVDLKREVVTSLPVPLPQFKPLEKVLSWKRAANAVSLLWQAVR
jgi:hypothetical protein